jgi:hypothetical protein
VRAVEEQAARIGEFEVAVIPGILQTADYAEAAIRASAPAVPLEDARARAVQRSHRFEAAAGRRIRIVIGEAALKRPVGGVDVLVGQLRHLLDLTALQPSLELRVLPSRADDGHPALVGAFSLYDRAVFLESLLGGTVLDRPERILPYTYAWDHAVQQAADPIASRRMILETRRRLVARR